MYMYLCVCTYIYIHICMVHGPRARAAPDGMGPKAQAPHPNQMQQALLHDFGIILVSCVGYFGMISVASWKSD